MSNPNNTQLILALDLPSEEDVLSILDQVGDSLKWVKVGLQLFTRYGPDIVKRIADKGYNIFLDLKLHDIPNTVASAVRSLRYCPVNMLSIHIAGGTEMVRWAVEAKQDVMPNCFLTGITVLTSLDQSAMHQLDLPGAPIDRVLHLAKLGLESGLDALVCSPKELATVHSAFQHFNPMIVTPGIRPAGADNQEQKRVMTPQEAAQAGAAFIVVGRPILRAENPQTAVNLIQQAIQLEHIQ